MFQIVTPCQLNASQLQIYGPHCMRTEQFIQPQEPFPVLPQEPFPVLPPNAVPIKLPDGNSVAPIGVLNNMIPPPAMSSSQHGSFDAGQVNFIQSDPYSCNFLVQLEGIYETDGAQIQVEIVEGDRQKYAKVHQQKSTGESVVDQLIYEDDTRFTLRLLNGYVLAVMVKGNNMKHSVT